MMIDTGRYELNDVRTVPDSSLAKTGTPELQESCGTGLLIPV